MKSSKEIGTECLRKKVMPPVRRCETLALEWDGSRILSVERIPQEGEGAV